MLPFELTKLTFRASYGVSFMSISTEIDRVIKGFHCTWSMGCAPKGLDDGNVTALDN